MTTLPTSLLFDVQKNDKVPSSALTYVKGRFKQDVYNLVVGQFKESGLAQVELARRLGKDATAVSRLFAGPGNMTLETVAETVFATSGNLVRIYIVDCKRGKMQTVDASDPLTRTTPFDNRCRVSFCAATPTDDDWGGKVVSA